MRRLVLLALALALLVPGAASAATVSYGEEPRRFTTYGTFSVEDPAGEANDLVVAFAPDGSFTVRDGRAPVTPGPGCEAIDERSARCEPGSALNLEVVVRAGAGDDRVDLAVTIGSADGGPGDDTLIGAGDGDGGGARLEGGPGRDRLEGAGGRDRLTGGEGPDVLLGGAGNDFLLGDGTSEGAPGDDVIDGGPGEDTVEYSERTAPVEVRLGAPGSGGAEGERDELRSIESVGGGAGPDRLVGDESPNRLRGCAAVYECPAAGGDVLEGAGGPDDLEGSPQGADVLVGGADADRLNGSGGDDRLFGGPGRDDVAGDAGDDLLADGAGEDRLDGGPGADRFDLDPGREDPPRTFDRVRCGDGVDRVAGPGRDDLLALDCERIGRAGPSLRIDLLPYGRGLIAGVRWAGRPSCRGVARLLPGPSGSGGQLAARRLRRRRGRPAATLVPPRAVGDAVVRLERLRCGRSRPRARAFGVFF